MKKKRILIADPNPQIIKQLKTHQSAKHYTFETAINGCDCLSKLETFKPDLLLVELMLPQIHGIEILRKIKTHPKACSTGVILTTTHYTIQNYPTAMALGCDYFLQKPFEPSKVFSLLDSFFKHKLQPAPLSSKAPLVENKHCYHPKAHSTHSYVKFWGTRGSIPVSGAEYVRFGGNTSCLEIRHAEDLIIVDAGTGIRPLGTVLTEHPPKNIHLLLSHTHWDHLAGFPFFAPIYDPKCTITIMTPIGFEKKAEDLFTEMLEHCYFPVGLNDIKATLIFKDIQEGIPFSVGKIHINSHYAYHPGATLCFKFTLNKTTFGYATDNEFLLGYHGNPSLIQKKDPLLIPYQSMIKFFKGCDFLVHEAQYTPQEYLKKVGWGHSCITNAAALVLQAGIHEWIVTHHDPKHTDQDIFQKMQIQYDVFKDLRYACRSKMAFDGLMIPIR